jgi:hypothetical protein
VLAGLSAVVVFPQQDGTVGTGCLGEVADAVFLSLPVWAFDGHGLVELSGFEYLPERRQTARRAAVLIAGRRLRPPALLAQLSDVEVVP